MTYKKNPTSIARVIALVAVVVVILAYLFTRESDVTVPKDTAPASSTY